MDRRDFLMGSGAALTATGMTARSYARIAGANSRIRLAQLGCGDRSAGHVHMAHLSSKTVPVEIVAVRAPLRYINSSAAIHANSSTRSRCSLCRILTE
jgi:hypothetical protein